VRGDSGRSQRSRAERGVWVHNLSSAPGGRAAKRRSSVKVE
jgi:hypothetical protein